MRWWQLTSLRQPAAVNPPPAPFMERGMDTKKIERVKAAVLGWVARIGHIWLFFAASLVLLLIVAKFNGLLITSYLWAASKITMAGAVGYALDRAAFPGSDPRYLAGIEQSMAQSRRGVVIAAAMIAAGLIG